MRRLSLIPLCVAAVAALLAPAGAGGHAGHGLEGVKVDRKGAVGLKQIGRFSHPTYITGHPTAGAVLVVQKFGRVIAVQGGKKRTFLNIGGQVGATQLNERGLLSIAFPPDFAASGLVYVFYTAKNGDLVISEFSGANDLSADSGSERVLLNVPHPGASNHNGGQIQFGPDGYLYISTGDGGGAGDPDDSAQDPNSLLGKILRIGPKPSATLPYTIPPDNPFAVMGGKPEIFSLGLRNPYRFSFDLTDPGDPRIAIGDVGQFRFEEVDYETLTGARGANFGWNDFEGYDRFSGGNAPTVVNDEKPILAYRTTRKSCAVIGGFVGFGKSPSPLDGKLLIGDFCNGKLKRVARNLGRAKAKSLGVTVPALTSFGQAPDGTLYAASLDGPVYRLTRGGRGGGKKK
jgi:glucose/arabinose dehydrogenase